MKMIEIRECDDYEAAKKLILEYSKIIGAEACFVSLDKELSDLKGFYKGGALLLGYDDGNPIATIAIRRNNDDQAEAKRLYIKPEYRGNGYARPLLNAMLDKCRALQFKEVRFTTKPEVMSIGYALYQRMGFEELENDGETVLMRMMLD
ncbi:MAG: GNAT family N-acetyltransferase [Butyrivibrio sp.]|nr:GNAT family N-acetyltransferase [Butyrivibrio sp.]